MNSTYRTNAGWHRQLMSNYSFPNSWHVLFSNYSDFLTTELCLFFSSLQCHQRSGVNEHVKDATWRIEPPANTCYPRER